MLHLHGNGEPVVFALSEATAESLAGKLTGLMSNSSVFAAELADGNVVTINFGGVTTAHIDSLPPLSRVYGAIRRQDTGLGRNN